MIKAIWLVFNPIGAWDSIIAAKRGMATILFAYLLPLLVLTSVVEGYGLVRWGEPQKVVAYIKKFDLGHAIVYESGQLLLSIAIVFIGAKMVKSLGDTFRGRSSFSQSFTVVAYGLSPLFAMRLLDALPISVWIAWAIGILLCMAILYHGVPRVMEPDPSHAFGFYLMSVLLLAITTGLARFVTAWYLQGKFKSLDSLVQSLTGGTVQ